MNFLWQPNQSGYQHVWPELEFGWRIIAGSVIGFFGAAFGSVDGVGGGGIFVPMLSLIIGFDPKSATAISKCMIMGAAISTVYYNLKLRHPTLDMPVIDYDLVLIIQPVLMLGISVGVSLNVIFADWMVTILLIILCIGTSMKAFFKGLDTWRTETRLKEIWLMETIILFQHFRRLQSFWNQVLVLVVRPEITSPFLMAQTPVLTSSPRTERLPFLKIYTGKKSEFSLLSALHTYSTADCQANCSSGYWALNLLQIPVSVGVFLFEAIGLYKGRRAIASKGEDAQNWGVHQLGQWCLCGIVAGLVGGLLGLGGGFIMGPLFLELGIPPQVASATATFGMTFSSSMSVVEFYLLNRFPVPYALYFVAVTLIAAFTRYHYKMISITGRASLIIFVLAFTIFVSAISLGGVGLSDMIGKIKRGEYMGFENLCKHNA